VSVGSDGTIMIWALDLNDPPPVSLSRDPSPAKEGTSTPRHTLRRVLSKAELAEFQRPSSPAGRRSPPRTVRRRTSRFNLAASINNSTKTPTGPNQASSGLNSPAEITSLRRPSVDSRVDSPPSSPQSKTRRRPSLPSLGVNGRKKGSISTSANSFGSLNMATEQACLTLRSYRKKLATSEPISVEALSELDRELRLTAAALGERAIRSKATDETVIGGLLDQYSERLIALLDEKLNLTGLSKDHQCGQPSGQQSSESPEGRSSDRAGDDSGEDRPLTADGDISSSSLESAKT
jgi:hypothetical protein